MANNMRMTKTLAIIRNLKILDRNVLRYDHSRIPDPFTHLMHGHSSFWGAKTRKNKIYLSFIFGNIFELPTHLVSS